MKLWRVAMAMSTPALCLTFLALGQSACSEVTAAGPATAPAAEGDPREKPVMPDAPFAVVEMFTSEGCSSCPPADAVLADLVADSRRERTRIFPLAFHVDYWDRLGWADRFGDPAHAARQSAYARSLKDESVYTPQMIVNGRVGFVGSDRNRARKEIATALGVPAQVAVALNVAVPLKPDALAVNYEVRALDGARADALKGAVLHLALVERDLVSEVERGENGGRTLRHQNVVRSFQTLPLDASLSGRAIVKVPERVNRELSSVIGYVQDTGGREILAAANVDHTPVAPKQQ